MDAPTSATCRLEGLHPKLPTCTRFCIVGGGPSGLSAAYALLKLGYCNVTVLEKCSAVAGMCETLQFEGYSYDLGGQVVAKDSAPTIMALANEMKLEMEDMSDHKLAIFDCNNKSYQDLDVSRDYISMMPLTLQLEAQARGRGMIGVLPMASLANDDVLLQLEKFEAQGDLTLKALPTSVATSYTASGYGFVEDMPYAYLHEFIRTSMFGKIRRFKAGFAGLWQSIAHRLPEVWCDTEVVAIERNSSSSNSIKVTVKTQQSLVTELSFDKLILTGALPFKYGGRTYRSPSTTNKDGKESNEFMSLSTKELEIFSKVKIIEYYTTVLRVSGLDLPRGFYYCRPYVEVASTIGHPVAMQRYHAETDVYLFWSYGNSVVDSKEVTNFLCEDIRAMGGTVEEIILQRKWDYFPHVSSADMKAGFYDELENLQGANDTLYLGGLLAFELTERNAAYAIESVAKHFGSTSPTLKYVKRLFALPLQGEGEHALMKYLSEVPGVDKFPDLPSLDAYLQFWARHPVFSSKVVYTWLNKEGKETDTLTYAELNSQASIIARHLLMPKHCLIPGDRVILLHPPGLQFIIAFFGCLKARVLPVPLIPPDPLQRPGQALEKVTKVAKITNAKAILTTSSYHSSVNLWYFRNYFSHKASLPWWPKLPWHCTDSWIVKRKPLLLANVSLEMDVCTPSTTTGGNKRRFSVNALPKQTGESLTAEYNGNTENHDNVPSKKIYKQETAIGGDEFGIPKPDDVCFLQFTSGSTGDAKGVIISHGGIMHNVKLMRSMYKSTSKTVLVSWLPQYHDMGLIGGLFTAMVSGGKAILFSPSTFIQRPMLWLETMSTYKATHSAGPNFAFELLVRRYQQNPPSTDIDLSSLCFLMVSAEPVRSRTMKEFVSLFQKTGFQEQVLAPGYGLAENCVFVCCAWGDHRPILVDWHGKVCCGYVEPHKRDDIDIRIVHPETCEEVNEGDEGEVWISSPSSGLGYWGQPQASTQVFKNTLAGSSSHFIRTGDLGRILDGKFFITGRIKDLIIIQGRNVYPADIEKTVEDSCMLIRPGCCAVLGVPQEVLESKGIVSPYSSDCVGVVVVAEVRNDCLINRKLMDDIKAVVAEEHGVQLACISFIKPRTICKTTSGKLRRFECLRQFCDEELQVVTDSLSCSSPTCATSEHAQIGYSVKTHTFSLSSLSPAYGDPVPETRSKSKEEILSFLTKLVAEKTSLHTSRISPSESLTSYGLHSTAVVWAAQKLSEFLGVQVAAIDIYTAGSLSELSDNVVALLCNSKVDGPEVSPEHEHVDQRSHLNKHEPHELQNSAGPMERNSWKVTLAECGVTSYVYPSSMRRALITILQLVGILYAAGILLVPGVFVCSIFTRLVAITTIPWFSVLLLPLACIAYTISLGIAISLLAVPFLQPNFYRVSYMPLWTVRFVKWWTLYRLQDFATTSVACNLKGTIFMAWWYRALGAEVGKDVFLDTTDVNELALITVGDRATVTEGATIQAHQVSKGHVRFGSLFVGRGAWMGPYSLANLGSHVPSEATIEPLHRAKGKTSDAISVENNQTRSPVFTLSLAIRHFFGLYLVHLVPAVSAILAYPTFMWLQTNLFQIPHNFMSDASSLQYRCAYIALPLAAALPWHLAMLIPVITFQDNLNPLCKALMELINERTALSFTACFVGTYAIYGAILCTITCILKWCLVGKWKPNENVSPSSDSGFRLWLVHQLITSAHNKFTIFLSGTEALCFYMRCMGSKVGQMASIRGVNPLTDPDLLILQAKCHLGDFAKIITSMLDQRGSLCTLGVKIGAQSVAGAHSVVLPGTTFEKRVLLGAMSVARKGSILKEGGIYVGVQNTVKANHQVGAEKHPFHPLPSKSAYETCNEGAATFQKDTMHKKENQTVWRASGTEGTCLKLAFIRVMQPLLQTTVPITLLMVAMYPCVLLLSFVASRKGMEMTIVLLPVSYAMFGLLIAVLSIICRWVLIGQTESEASCGLWSFRSLFDSVWQAVHLMACTNILELTKGSLLCVLYFNGMGACISMQGVYMDTLYALNPDLLEVGAGACIGRNALLFGHLYEGERVVFRKVELGDGVTVGTRALLLPGVRMNDSAHLEPLGLGMKDEIIGSSR